MRWWYLYYCVPSLGCWVPPRSWAVLKQVPSSTSRSHPVPILTDWKLTWPWAPWFSCAFIYSNNWNIQAWFQVVCSIYGSWSFLCIHPSVELWIWEKSYMRICISQVNMCIFHHSRHNSNYVLQKQEQLKYQSTYEGMSIVQCYLWIKNELLKTVTQGQNLKVSAK